VIRLVTVRRSWPPSTETLGSCAADVLGPRSEGEIQFLNSVATHQQIARWLDKNGVKELELLFQAIIYHLCAPILITDSRGICQDASAGAVKLLGLLKEKIAGRQIAEFVQARSKSDLSLLFKTLHSNTQQEGPFCLLSSSDSVREVAYTATGNVLPGRHLLLLSDKLRSVDLVPAALDYAFYLLDANGRIAAWYEGAERLYGYKSNAVTGKDVSILYAVESGPQSKAREQLHRAELEGHAGVEEWQTKKDGTKFWSGVITVAMKDESGQLQGFAAVVRDFSGRHESDEKLRRSRTISRPDQAQSAIAGIVSGEFDYLPQANDTFLEIVGYSREDLESGRLHWPDLTPAEYLGQDELAHEEELRFGACTPYEKELVRRDGTRVPVLVTTAVLKLAPFRWITFVQDLRERDRLETVEEQTTEPVGDFSEIVGSSTIMRRVMGQVELVAPTDATVLILGETGTGKELIARAIHKISPRRNLPFVTLNCAAIPTGLLESELFGYERGAFTGALSQKIGRFEMAHKGTLFLDEVGDIPIDLQPKLLRALQEKSFERLGGTRTIPIDVRLLAATNRNLNQMMGDKLFRSDLYYRLKVFPITTPPLRDRPEDIPVLVRHFTKKYASKMDRQIEKIPTDTMAALVSWRWPGNVRELENFIERSVILSKGPSLRAPLAEIREDASEPNSNATLEQVERDYIVRVLRESGGVVTAAATKLGLHRTTLNAMMRKLGISRKDF
jgi:formate hydrogenlyase transcriptional activator